MGINKEDKRRQVDDQRETKSEIRAGAISAFAASVAGKKEGENVRTHIGRRRKA